MLLLILKRLAKREGTGLVVKLPNLPLEIWQDYIIKSHLASFLRVEKSVLKAAACGSMPADEFLINPQISKYIKVTPHIQYNGDSSGFKIRIGSE